jgi:type II secretory pathway pseudopilin PulG
MRGDWRQEEWGDEQGSMLLGLVVAIFLILLVLSMAAPKVAQELKREREVEAVHRGNQYVRAIQLFYKKTGGQYPGSLEALEKTNNIRFLRQRYLDPMTGKADWRLIKMGEAKTTVKGFFGKPLTGLAPGLGSAAGMASSGQIGAGAAGTSSGSAFGSSSGSSGSAFGGSSGSSAFGSSSSGGSSFGSSSFGSGSGTTSGSGSPGAGATGSATGSGTAGSTGSSGTGSTDGSSSSGQPGSGLPGGGGPFMGVGLPQPGDSIVVLNEQTTYQTWEFLYDPRIEQLKAQASLFGGAPTAGSAGSLGSAAGMSSGTGGTSTPGVGGTNSGFGSSSGSSFGSSSGSSFGSTPSNGTGSTGTGSTGSGSTGTTPQQ